MKTASTSWSSSGKLDLLKGGSMNFQSWHLRESALFQRPSSRGLKEVVSLLFLLHLNVQSGQWYSTPMNYVHSRMRLQEVIQKATSSAAWWKQSTCSCLVVSLSLYLWLLFCSSLPSIIVESTEEGIYIVPCACLGLSKYQFITNLPLQGTIHWHVRTLQFTQCSLVLKEPHDRISKQKEFHNVLLELLIKITAGWQERHMVDLRCMATVFCFKKNSFLLLGRVGERKRACEYVVHQKKTPTLRSHWWGVSVFTNFLFHCSDIEPL